MHVQVPTCAKEIWEGLNWNQRDWLCKEGRWEIAGKKSECVWSSRDKMEWHPSKYVIWLSSSS